MSDWTGDFTGRDTRQLDVAFDLTKPTEPTAPPELLRWNGVVPLRTDVVVRWQQSPISSRIARLDNPVTDADGKKFWKCGVYPRPGSGNFGIWVTLVPLDQIHAHPDARPLVVPPKFASTEEADAWLVSQLDSE